MASPVNVAVVGMRALRADLTRLGADVGPLNKGMSAAGKVAVDPVAAATRDALPRVSGRLAGDVRTSATKTGATVRMGRVSVPYAGFVDFGGDRSDPHESSRAYTARGRYLFPQAERLSATVGQRYSDAIAGVLDAFNWTNDTTNPGSIHD